MTGWAQIPDELYELLELEEMAILSQEPEEEPGHELEVESNEEALVELA